MLLPIRPSLDVRAHISVTDSGGDGALIYNNSTGVITYTGPSAAETRAHFSGGTGVSIAGGAISIGLSVGTGDDVTFTSVTADLIGDVTGSVSSLSNHDTDDLNEGSSNFYYTEAKFNTSLGVKSTDNLSEGSIFIIQKQNLTLVWTIKLQMI